METPNWGDNWDQKIIHWLIDEFKNDQGIDLSGDAILCKDLKKKPKNKNGTFILWL